MILAVGEILADMIAENGNNFQMFAGGAPFNVGVNAKQAGSSVAFVGRVGKDPIGKYLVHFANEVGFTSCDIQVDSIRNTTLALVTLDHGERDFAFFRHDTADYNIDIEAIDFKQYKNLSIVHLGSLMLSTSAGRKAADALIKKVKDCHVLLSFDVNLRMDLFKNEKAVIDAFLPYIRQADILKFSDDEILMLSGKKTVDDAIQYFQRKDQLMVVTLGHNGSRYIYNELGGIVPTKSLETVVDTTGAGDAFFGTLLSQLDGRDFTKLTNEFLIESLKKANLAGGRTTQFKGAIKL